MRIIKLEEDMSKFKPENKEIEVENMRSFVTKYKVKIRDFILPRVSQDTIMRIFVIRASSLDSDTIKL
jgi:hypothetical protein